MGYSINATTSDCYEGTLCLINKFNVRDSHKLAELEAAITYARYSELECSPPERCSFDFDFYKAIHKYLFGDIYEWAGQIRTIDISKKRNTFCKSNRNPSCSGKNFFQITR